MLQLSCNEPCGSIEHGAHLDSDGFAVPQGAVDAAEGALAEQGPQHDAVERLLAPAHHVGPPPGPAVEGYELITVGFRVRNTF